MEHSNIFTDCCAGSCQHIAGNGGAGAAEKGGLAVLWQNFAAGCQADIRSRVDVAEKGDCAQDIFCRELRQVFEFCAFNRHQGIDWNGFDAEFSQADGHVQPILPGFTHADDTAGANAETFCLRDFDRADLIVIGVGCAYFREKAARCFDVVVIACDTGIAELAKLLGGQEAVGGAEVKMAEGAHFPVDFQRFAERLTAEGPAGSDDGKTMDAFFFVGEGIAGDFLFAQEIVFGNACVVLGGLRAVFAVFAAAAAAPVDDGAQIDMIAAEVTP